MAHSHIIVLSWALSGASLKTVILSLRHSYCKRKTMPSDYVSPSSKEHPIYYIVAVVFIAISIAGIMMLHSHQKNEALRKEAELRRLEMEREHELELKRQEAAERAKIAIEKDRLEKEQRVAEIKNNEQEQERLVEVDNRAALRESQQQLRESIKSLRTIRLDYWRNCPKELRPESVVSDQEYFCVVPNGTTQAIYLKIVAKPQEAMIVSQYQDDGSLDEVTNERFNELIKGTPYIIKNGDNAWVCGTKRNIYASTYDAIPFPYSPGNEEFGSFKEFASYNGISLDGFKYKFTFTENGHKIVYNKKLNINESVSKGEIKTKIRSVLQEELNRKPKKVAKSKSGKKIKRTVVFADIDRIDKNIGGPIRIPRNMPVYHGSTGNSHYHYEGNSWEVYRGKSTNVNGHREREYLRLREIALREDEMERNARSSGGSSAPRSVTDADVERVFRAGRFIYEPL